MKCPICSTENPPDRSSCSQCGFNLGLSQSAWPDSPDNINAAPAESEAESLAAEDLAPLDKAPAACDQDASRVELAVEREETTEPVQAGDAPAPAESEGPAGSEVYSDEIEALLQDLQSDQPLTTRLMAATSLGEVDSSGYRVLEALVTARETDPASLVRKKAAAALNAPAHLALLQRYPDLRKLAITPVEEVGPREQKAWVDPNWRGQSQKRKKPTSPNRNCLTILGASVGLIIGIIWMVNAGSGTDFWRPGLLILAALYFLGKHVYDYAWSGSDSNLFLRSHETTVAKVVRKREEEYKDEYDQKKYRYYLSVQFDTDDGEVILEAPVSKRYFDQYAADSEMEVRYATENPLVALLEGE
jgi:hypothetical protein